MAVTKEQARIAIVNQVEALKATWVGYPLVIDYDNRNLINYGTQVDPFLSVEIQHMDSYQTNLGPQAAQRVLGVITLTAKARSGSGVKQVNDLLTHFYPTMHMTDVMSPVRTYAARLITGTPEQEWIRESAVIPFWYDN